MDDTVCYRSSIPKLSFSSLQSKLANSDPRFMSTPPVHASASVPFEWEESPGVPRMQEATELNDKSLELPPRLVAESVPSPTTVLDGPYPGRSRSFSIARSGREKVGFGSARWMRGQPRKAESSDESNEAAMKRVKSGLRLVGLSRRRSPSSILTSFVDSCKQAVIWKCNHHAMGKAFDLDTCEVHSFSRNQLR